MIFCDIVGRSPSENLKIHAVIQAANLDKAKQIYIKAHPEYDIYYAKACDIGESILCERKVK